LEALKDKKRDGEIETRAYIRQFSAISAALMKKEQIEDYTRGIWFLNGLPQGIRSKVIRKNKINIEVPLTMVYTEMVKTAIEILASNKTVREFDSNVRGRESLSRLVDHFGNTVQVPKENQFSVPVVASRAQTVTEEAIEDLTKAFQSMAMSAMATISSGPQTQQLRFDPSGGANRGAYPTGATGRVDPSAPLRGPMPQAGVFAGEAFRPRSIRCYYCLEDGHIRRDCPDFGIDQERGLVCESAEGRMYFGKPDEGGKSAYVPRGEKGKDIVRRFWEQAAPQQATGGPAPVANQIEQRPILLRPSTVTSVGGMSGRVVEIEESDDDEIEAGVTVAAAELRGGKGAQDNERWENPRRTLKERISREKKMATPKVPRAGNWKKTTVEDVVGGDEVEEMDIDKEQTEALKRAGPRPTRRVEKYLDVLKGSANPLELIDKILDNELKGITGREVLACSDMLQKLLFKNMVTATPTYLKAKPEEDTVAVKTAVLEEVESPFIVTSPKVRVIIGDIEVVALIDCGAEADIIATRVAERAGLGVRPDPYYGMIGHSGERKKFDGACDNVTVKIGSVGTTTNFFTMDHPQNDVVLGQPFIISSLLSFSYRDGFQYATIVNDERTKQVTVRVASMADARGGKDAFQGNL
jgi:hypothetical protein